MMFFWCFNSRRELDPTLMVGIAREEHICSASWGTECQRQHQQQQPNMTFCYREATEMYDDIGQDFGVIDRGAVSGQHTIP